MITKVERESNDEENESLPSVFEIRPPSLGKKKKPPEGNPLLKKFVKLCCH